MYFNIKYERTGGLFAGPFRSKHMSDDGYFQKVIQYIHCNPAEIFEPKWKEGEVQDLGKLEKNLLEYPYSSFGPFADAAKPFRKILCDDIFEIETQFPPSKMLREALEYYHDVKVSP